MLYVLKWLWLVCCEEVLAYVRGERGHFWRGRLRQTEPEFCALSISHTHSLLQKATQQLIIGTKILNSNKTTKQIVR